TSNPLLPTSYFYSPTSSSEVVEEKLGDAPEQVQARGAIADAVAASRIDLNFGVAARLDELLGELNGVGEVDVVVVGAGGNQKFALELGGVGYRRRILVALGVVLRQAHVALGVDGVVLAPVCDRRAGEPGLEDLGRVQHRVASHVSAIAPAPDANARAVYVGQCLQIADAGELVGEFHLTHPMK